MRPPEPTYIENDMRSQPPSEKAKLKALGARFDAQRQRWFVPAGHDLAPFAPWLSFEPSFESVGPGASGGREAAQM